MVTTTATKRLCNTLILHEVQSNIIIFSGDDFISCVFIWGNNTVHGLFVTIMVTMNVNLNYVECVWISVRMYLNNAVVFWTFVSRGWRASRSAGAGANVSRRSVHVKPRIRGRFVALERHGDEGRAGAQEQRIVQRGFAKLMYSANSRDGALRKRELARGCEQERRGGCECQSAISPRQASDSWTFRGAGACRKALYSVNVRNANFSNS